MSLDWESQRIRRLRWVPITCGGIAFAFYWIQIIFRPRGDFPRHWEFGRRILAGEFIYGGGLNVVYPPFWAFAHAPLALVGSHIAQVVVYPLAPLAIAALLWILNQLTKDPLPLDDHRLFWSTSLAIFLASNFLLRDLPEIGVNTALVALSWLAIFLWSRQRDVLAGASLGLAIALKCTPLLFVAYFALKRQWKFVLASLVFFALFTLSPIVLQGPDAYNYAMRTWTETVVGGLTDPDPSRSVLGQDKVGNLSLRPALARYLMHLPYGHLGRPETSDNPDQSHGPPTPLYIHFGNVSPFWAGWIVKTTMVTLLLAIGWFFRGIITYRKDLSIIWECAGVSLLILLFSPLTWRQHCVGVLPALYLICRGGFAGHSIPKWIVGAVIMYGFVNIGLNREFLGKDLSRLLDSYHIKTLGIILLTIAALGYRKILVTSSSFSKGMNYR